MVFLDASILLEVLLPDRAKVAEVSELLATLVDTPAISMLTVHLVLHFGRVAKIPTPTLHEALASYHIIPLTHEDYTWARINEVGKDFEDALQVAAALRRTCSQFITIDRNLAKRYSAILPVSTV